MLKTFRSLEIDAGNQYSLGYWLFFPLIMRLAGQCNIYFAQNKNVVDFNYIFFSFSDKWKTALTITEKKKICEKVFPAKFSPPIDKKYNHSRVVYKGMILSTGQDRYVTGQQPWRCK